MERIRAVHDHDESILETSTISCDEKYLHSAAAFHTSDAFRLVNAMDSFQSLVNLPLHNMQSGFAALIRKSGGILDIRHCPLQPVQLCHWLRQSASCSLPHGMFVGQPTCVKLALQWDARFHAAEKHPLCPLRCHDGLHCIRHFNRCPALFESLYSFWLGSGECISPTAIFNEFRFKIAVRSDRLCILISGLLDAFVTANNMQRTSCGPGLNFREVMRGRIKMVTALSPAWAHTYQTM